MTSNERQIWTPERSGSAVRRLRSSPSGDGDVGWPDALGRGLRARCPVCGQARLFAGYLSVVDRCPVCGTPLASVPADDAPPWVTILIALHVLIGLVVLLGRTTRLGTASTIAIVLPLSVVLCLALLRPVKGCIVAILLKLDVTREDQNPT